MWQMSKMGAAKLGCHENEWGSPSSAGGMGFASRFDATVDGIFLGLPGFLDGIHIDFGLGTTVLLAIAC